MFYDNFKAWCTKKGETPTWVGENVLGVSSAAVAQWKKRGTTPKYDTLQKIAEYFGITVDTLLGPFPPEPVMFWKNFYNLCQKANKSPNAVAKELGISSGAVTSWKNGKTPHHGTLIKIAQFFGVSTDFLLGVTPGSHACSCRTTASGSIPR